MVRAFAMVETDSGASEAVVESIADIDTVGEANVVAGDYDVIVEIEAEEVYEIFETISGVVGGLEGVQDTKTYVALGV